VVKQARCLVSMKKNKCAVILGFNKIKNQGNSLINFISK
jgi:hypothetical protein